MKKKAIQGKAAQPTAGEGELSDAELDIVTGGVRHSLSEQGQLGTQDVLDGDSSAKCGKATSKLLRKFAQTSDLITGNMK